MPKKKPNTTQDKQEKDSDNTRITELEAQLADRKVTIEITPAARDWLGERGYDSKMGARPMARVIQDQIKKPLADELLFGKLMNGGHVRIDVDNDTLSFDLKPLKARQAEAVD